MYDQYIIGDIFTKHGEHTHGNDSQLIQNMLFKNEYKRRASVLAALLKDIHRNLDYEYIWFKI